MTDQPITRSAVIGYGLFGKHHARAIQSSSATELVAIAVPSAESQAAASEAHPGVTVVADYRQLLGRDDIDVFNVVVPNVLHYQVASEAIEAGHHVLLEKPMAVSVADCDQLIQLAQDQQRVLAVGHELRLSRLWGQVKQLIDAGTIGTPQYVLVELSRFPYRPGSSGWRYDQQRVGSWILEEPIHFFDLARWYLSACGEATSIYARANSRDPQRPELHDNFSSIVNFPGEAYAVISQSLAAFGHHQVGKVVGSEGTIWADWGAADARSPEARFSLQYGLADNVTDVPFDAMTGELVELALEIEAMAMAVQAATPPPATGEDGRWSTLLCLAAAESIQRGELVGLADFVENL